MGFNSKYKSSEIEEILDDANEKLEVINNIVDEDGYLYSNGEKVDMRFTRSLLPVGTAIPASVNLNTIQYLKIGKYYCSLNVDAETITNCPVKVAFSMEVFNPLGTNVDDETTREYTYRLRVLTQYDSGTQYMQFCKTSGTAGRWTYGDWYAAPRTKATLNSNKKGSTLTLGSATQGVYVNSTGVLTKMTYTLGKSVPSNAVFTDTDTKVTSVSNHYSPTEDDSVALNAPDGEVIVGLKRDATGHIVGIETAQYIGGGETPDMSGYVTEDQLMWTKAEGEAGVRLKGTNGTATGNLAISAGDDKTASDGTPFTSAASGDHAVVFGYGNTCAGRSTLAQGLYNIVNGKDSVAFGQRNLVDGDQAFAVGQQNKVTARLGVAIGYKNKATNTDSIAIGYQNTSSGSASVAMGDTCEAIGTSSTAMGYKTKATGAYTSTFGQNTQATNAGEVAMGLYNKSTTSDDASEQTLFSFGIGTSDTERTNAFEIKKNGDVYIGDKLLSVEDFMTAEDLATVATSGDYNDLTNKPTIPAEQVNADWNATSGKAQILNKPTIPSAVTESTVTDWGFTKNTGTYSKPSGGIPESDLASEVQNSLGKADTALQSYTEQYKGTVTGVKVNGVTSSPNADGLVDLGTIGGGEVQITKAPIATSYAIYFDDSNPMLPGKVYVGYSGYTIVEIQTLTPPTGTYGEYKLHFYAPSASTTISLPDYVLLANGEIATPEAGSYYELSIVATRENLYDSFVYSAVLTPFKSI